MIAAKTVGDLSVGQFAEALAAEGLGVDLGACRLWLRARVAGLVEPLHRMYWHYALLDANHVFSCHASLVERPRRPWRRRAMIRFEVDGMAPHEDMPAEQALAILEWGINLVFAMRLQSFLMLHAAALERNGRVLLLPAAPGSGKTTLTVALAHRGWRLFSDEFGLLRPGSRDVHPLPRPMPLKNASIDVIRRFAPDAVLGAEIAGTRKGTVAHVRPPATSVHLASVSAPVRWCLFPQWQPNATLAMQEISGAEAFMHLATNAFNYGKLGEPAFHTVRTVISRARCFRLRYSDLAAAVDTVTTLADDDAD